MSGGGRDGRGGRLAGCYSCGVAGLLKCSILKFALCAGLMAACAAGGGCTRVTTPGQPIAQRAVIGSPGMEPGRFAKPRCIAADAKTIWVVDRAAKVQRFDPESGLCLQWFTMPESELGKPTGITVGPSPAGDGAMCLYLADTHYNRVVVYAIPELPRGWTPGSNINAPVKVNPVEVLRFGSYGMGPGQMVYPTGVAVLTAADGKTVERLYVTEYGGNDRVQVFDAKGQPLFSFGVFGDGQKPETVEFNRPQSIAILRSNDAAKVPTGLLVTDSCNHRLGLFDLDGKLERWLGSPLTGDSAAGNFYHPRGITILPDGTVLIVEFGNNRVQRVNLATGECLGLWGKGGRGDGELAEPWGLARLGLSVYIVDAMNHRVVVADIP